MTSQDHALDRSLSLGQRLLTEHRLEELEALAGELVALYPGSLSARLLWAKVAQRREAWGTAVERWSFCQERFPGELRPFWLHAEGRALMEMGRYLEAERVYLRAARLFPHEFASRTGLASIARRRKDWPTAIDRWSLCLKRFPEQTQPFWLVALAHAYLEQGRLREAEAVFKKLSRRFSQEASGHIGLASIAQRRRDWPTAVKRWSLCQRRFADKMQPFWLTALANAHMELGQFREAQGICQTAIQRFPKDPGGHVGLARIALIREQWPDAARHWQTLVNRFPDRGQWRLHLAKSLIGAGRSRELEKTLEPLLGDSAFRPKAIAILAHNDMRRKRWESAASRFRLLQREVTDDPAVLVAAGMALGRLGLFDESLRAIRTARDLDPGRHVPWLREIQLLFLQAEPGAEINSIGEEATTRLSCHDPAEAALLLDKLGRFARAQAIRTRLTSVSSAEVRRHLATHALKAGRYDSVYQYLLHSPALAGSPLDTAFRRELSLTSTSEQSLRNALAAGRPVMRLERLAARVDSWADPGRARMEATDPLVFIGLSGHRGGAERDLINLILGMRANGFAAPIHLILPPKGECPESPLFYFDDLIRHQVRVSHLDQRSNDRDAGAFAYGGNLLTELYQQAPTPELGIMARYWDRLAALNPQTVVVWSTGFPHLLAALAALLTNTRKILFSLRGHGLLAEIERDMERVYLAKRLMGHLFRSQRVSVAACSAALLQRHVAETTWDGSNGQVIYPGIVEGRLCGSSGHNKAIESFRIPPDAFCIGGVFRLSWEKRPLGWARIAARVLTTAGDRNVCFVILGDGPMSVAMKEELDRLGISRRCIMVGEMDDVDPWYRRMDLLLHIPRSEGLGNAMAEAQWYGVPVITTDIGGCPETIVPNQSGWIEDPNHPDAIVRRVLWCMDSPEQMQLASRAAMRHARERFSSDCVREKQLAAMGLPAWPSR